MKKLKEFKYQDQLDGKVTPKAPVSRFDLICGMLLTGLALGLIIPSAREWLKDQPPMSLAARVAPDMNEVDESPAAVNSELTVANIEKPPVLQVEPAYVPDKEPPHPSAKIPPKSLMRVLPKSVAVTHNKTKHILEKTKQTKVASHPLNSTSGKVATPKMIEVSLTETDATLSAQDFAARSDATLMAESGPNEKTKFVTLNNASYQKEGLADCKVRCVVRGTDASGHIIQAVVSGPEFADILSEHKGTINLTGIKRKFKSHDFFMVQNITFNVAAKKGAVAHTEIKKNASEALRLSTYKSTISDPEVYEDLNSDPSPAR